MPQKKPKKKNRRILLQTGVAILVLLFVCGLIMSAVLFMNSLTTIAIAVADNQQSFVTYTIDEMDDFAAINWLVDYWSDHPGEISEDEILASYGEMAEILKKLSYPDCHFVTEEEAEKLTEEEQKVFAGFSYMELADTYRQLTEELPVDQILCYVPDEDDLNHGLILFDGVKLEENLGTGAVRTEAVVSEDAAGNVTIKIVNPNQEAVKDKTQNSVSANPDDTTETTAVGIWTDLSTKRKVAVGAEINARLIWRMLHNSGRYILYNLIAVVAFTALVLFFLYLIVSRPLTKVKKAMVDYREDKDANRVSEALSRIHSRNEIGVLADEFTTLTQEMERYTLEMEQVAAEREHAATELNVATSIQSDMLPSDFPPFPDRHEFDIYATMEPAKGVAGDFYDFYFLDEDHLVLTIADVSGKSIPAALFMAIAKTTLKNRAITGGGTPAEILEDTNNQLCEGNKSNFFVTVWLGILTVSTGELFVANAGHEYPAIRHGDQPFELVRTKHGPMVGAVEGLVYHNEHYKLDPGDALFLYTDGVTEASALDQSMFTEQRLQDVLQTTAKDDSAEEILSTVRKAIGDFVGEAPQFDDLTMLSFIYYGKEE